MHDLLDIKGRTALVTGAGQGVGRRVVLHLAEHGAGAVIVNDYRAERAEAVAAEVEALGVRAVPAACDVSDLGAVQTMVRQATESAGAPVDILVNNAGNAGPNPTEAMSRPFWEQRPDEWNGFLGTNLYGVLNTTHSTVGEMIDREYGRIVNVVSDAARFGEKGRESYSAAKAGAAGFTRSLAASAGRYGVTANCVSLAATRTPRTADRLEDEQLQAAIMKRYIIRRPGEPEDAANMILFLCSDAASWVTGQTFPVNGGYSFAL
ncbi:3-oxoacyl-[acyl-carrier protein] reductase [Lipingzhangella halophila]|uniref:3-oxoacyl-[acyl-carrier protein] reductase n=1 Tax=Lipingzhangella halophila TaxID=1783352 RepID=A0A7W7W6L5_9ACTN|nr:SDR family NAD(P)-dependent oxidoreductase [Lipingzhangella halophila]MBB4934965.1 3-oxoacyl-[acyl-carrier protein] reductase [Lipingzhangella halophila]